MPISTPHKLPAMLSARSTFDGTRCGRKFCSVSIVNDSAAPAATAMTAARLSRSPERTSAPNSSVPSGR